MVAEAPEFEAIPVVSPDGEIEEKQEEVLGGGLLEGVGHVLRSPYLLGLAALIALFAIVSTFLYFQLIAIVESEMAGDDVGQTRLFAVMEVVVQSLTLVTQVFLTGRILKWFGLGFGASRPSGRQPGRIRDSCDGTDPDGRGLCSRCCAAPQTSRFSVRRERSSTPLSREPTSTRRRTSTIPSSTALLIRSVPGPTPPWVGWASVSRDSPYRCSLFPPFGCFSPFG